MDFPIFPNFERPNGRKSWHQLSHDQKRNICKKYYGSLENAFKLNQPQHDNSYCRELQHTDVNSNQLNSPSVCHVVKDKFHREIPPFENQDVTLLNTLTRSRIVEKQYLENVRQDNFHGEMPVLNNNNDATIANDFAITRIAEEQHDKNVLTCTDDSIRVLSSICSSNHEVANNIDNNISICNQNDLVSVSASDKMCAPEPTNHMTDESNDFERNPYLQSNLSVRKMLGNESGFSQYSFRQKLAECFVKQKINQTQGKAILNVLHNHPSLKFLPKDHRALLQTPRDVIETKTVEPGKYLHIGIESMLILTLSSIPANELPNVLIMDFSTDGAEANANIQMWPIQIRIVNMTKIKKPLLVGMYEGTSKPNSFEDFFADFVAESKIIMKNGGIVCSFRLIPIGFRCLVADTPARSYVLNHMSHVAKFPCSRCKVEGITYRHSRRFHGVDHEHRTDWEYRKLKDVDHHLGKSAIQKLPIDLVKQVSFDYMHLVCLGVTKKFIKSVVFGKCRPDKLQSFEEEFLSNRLVELQDYCPHEFARKPREIKFCGKYKATEFRQLLLYTFIVVSPGIITTDQYNHFLLLQSSMRVLLDNSSPPDLVDFADAALKKFVLDAEQVQGLEFLTYNTHGLLHLVLDFKEYGSLEDLSAFTYENVMKEYREFLNKPTQLLQQIHKRICEQSRFLSNNYEKEESESLEGSEIHKKGPIVDEAEGNCVQYRKLRSSKLLYPTGTRDNTIITQDGRIGIIKNIFFTNNNFFLAVQFFKKLKPFYYVLDRPSTDFGVFLCTGLQSPIEFVIFAKIQRKCFRMPVWIKKMLTPTVTDDQINNGFVVAVML